MRVGLMNSRDSEKQRWIQPKLSSVVSTVRRAAPVLAVLLACVVFVPRAQGRASVTLRVNVNVVSTVWADGAGAKRTSEATIRPAVSNTGAILVLLKKKPQVESQETLRSLTDTSWTEGLLAPCGLSSEPTVQTKRKTTLTDPSEDHKPQTQPSADIRSSQAVPCRVATRTFLPR
jgi:hypothetical protein